MGSLTVAPIKALTEPGRYVDRDGLMLRVATGGFKQWILRVRIDGKRRDMGLGSLKVLTLAEARAKAAELRRESRAASIRSPKGRRSKLRLPRARRSAGGQDRRPDHPRRPRAHLAQQAGDGPARPPAHRSGARLELCERLSQKRSADALALWIASAFGVARSWRRRGGRGP